MLNQTVYKYLSIQLQLTNKRKDRSQIVKTQKVKKAQFKRLKSHKLMTLREKFRSHNTEDQFLTILCFPPMFLPVRVMNNQKTNKMRT